MGTSAQLPTPSPSTLTQQPSLPAEVVLSLLGTGVALDHLGQLHFIVEAQQPHPMLGSILDLCNLLTGVGTDDLTGRDTDMLDQLHLCL